MSDLEKNGHCLCGKVSFSVKLKRAVFSVCHCGMCRRWSGGPGFTVDGSQGITFKGEGHIKVYESSAWAERAFCKHCGSHLFYRLKQGNFLNFNLGLLEDISDFSFNLQIYIDNKPACYDFANTTKKLTEAEVVAKFSGK